MFRKRLQLFLPLGAGNASRPSGESARSSSPGISYENPLIARLSKLALSDEDRENQQLHLFQFRKHQVGQLKTEDFEKFGELGSGEMGVVQKELHKPTGFIMARKIYSEVTPRVTAKILQDLSVLHDSSSSHVVGYYGFYSAEKQLYICMEYMDAGSLDFILTHFGPVPENAMATITQGVLKGLIYLKDKHNLLHGNVKPASILVNSRGNVKLCDVAVSKLLPVSMPKCFLGAKSYMSPEAIQGQQFLLTADIWSLGLSIVELLTGTFPIPTETSPKLTIFELLNYIVNQPAPQLTPGQYSRDLVLFVNSCLRKNPRDRPDVYCLLEHDWIERWEREKFDFVGWVVSRMERYVSTPATV